jgi:hypothetical protein
MEPARAPSAATSTMGSGSVHFGDSKALSATVRIAAARAFVTAGGGLQAWCGIPSLRDRLISLLEGCRTEY